METDRGAIRGVISKEVGIQWGHAAAAAAAAAAKKKIIMVIIVIGVSQGNEVQSEGWFDQSFKFNQLVQKKRRVSSRKRWQCKVEAHNV
jgi:hypothetical protein